MNVFVDLANYILSFINDPSDEVKATVVAFSLASPFLLLVLILAGVEICKALKSK